MKKLIQVETTAEMGELAAAKVISAKLDHFGIDYHIDCWDRTRANIIAHVNSTRRKGALLFVCHLDVVGPGEASWRHPPFAAVESDSKIYGRGSADMKGGIAAVVTAICGIVDSDTKLQGDIIFSAVAGEETDSCGVKRFVSGCDWLGERAPILQKKREMETQFVGVVIPEPTDFAVVTAHRGLLWLKVTTKGKAAHASTPELGVNAIASMRAVLDALENYKIPAESHKLLGSCSMSINTITGGKEINVIPDSCSIEIDIRTVPAQNHNSIITDFERIFAKLKANNPRFDAEVSVVRQVEPLETDRCCDFVKDFCSAVGANETKAVGFTTDGPYFASLGAPVVIFGPGKPGLAHKPDEYIDISDVEKAVEIYKNIILKFLT